MAEEFEFKFNRDILNTTFKAGPFRITQEMIALHTTSTGETNPKFVGDGNSHGMTAPPSLPVLLIDDWEPPDLQLDFDGVLYLAGYWVEPIGAVRPGDVLDASITVTDVYAKTGRSGPMVFLKKEALFTNQDGAPVVKVGASSVWRK